MRCRADAVDEARAGHLGAALGVDASELEVIARLEVEGRRLADPPELDGVVVREAVGALGSGGEGRALGQLDAPPLRGGELLLDLLELGLDASAPRSARGSACP